MSKSPHLLFINEFYYPDICASAVVAAEQTRRIAAMRPDWRITVLTGNRAWQDSSLVYPPEGDHQGVHILRVSRPPMGQRNLLLRGLGFLIFQRNVVRAAARLPNVDLAVGTTAPPQGGSIARTIGRLHGCPYIYKVLDLYPDLVSRLGKLRADSFVYRRWLARDSRAMGDAAAVVTISTPITERIIRTRPVDPTKVMTIHDGDDDERLKCATAPRREPGSFIVQYAGNMGLSHPFETILDAANRMFGDANVRFQFIGAGPGREALQQKLPANSELLDYQPAEQLGQVLAGADVCLISQQESMFDQAMPFKIYAILAAGRPVVFVGSRRSEIAEWVRQHELGEFVEQGQGAELAEKLSGLKRDPGRRAEMGRRSRRAFEEHFRSETAAQQWVGLIGRVLSGNPGGKMVPNAGLQD